MLELLWPPLIFLAFLIFIIYVFFRMSKKGSKKIVIIIGTIVLTFFTIILVMGILSFVNGPK